MPTRCTHARTRTCLCDVCWGTHGHVCGGQRTILYVCPGLLCCLRQGLCCLLAAHCPCRVGWPTDTVNPWISCTCTIVPGFYVGSGNSKAGSHTCVTGILTYKTLFQINYPPSPQPHFTRKAFTDSCFSLPSIEI